MRGDLGARGQGALLDLRQASDARELQRGARKARKSRRRFRGEPRPGTQELQLRVAPFTALVDALERLADQRDSGDHQNDQDDAPPELAALT